VIPVCNRYGLTTRCLMLLREQTAPHRVIVVDDGSTDGTAERLRADWPEVSVVRLEGNQGFAKACNRGVAEGSGDVVVLLNNDVDCSPELLERLVSRFEDPSVGSAAPLMLQPGGERIDSIGLSADVTLAGFPRQRDKPLACARDAFPALAGPAGSAAAYRRTAWEDVGGLDEAIYAYMEDFDLALRLRAAGWRSVTAPDAVGVHLGSATYGHRSAEQRRHGGFARGYLLRRYGLLRGRTAPRTLATETIVVLGDLAASRDPAALRGRLSGWHAARRQPQLPRPPAEAIESGISQRGSLALRRGIYRRRAMPFTPADTARCPACGGGLGLPLLSSPDRLHGVPGTFFVALCETCGLGVTLPAVEPAELAAFYPQTYGAYQLPVGALRLVSGAIQRAQAWHALRTAPLARLAELPAGRLLDIGCGRGDLGSWFVRRGWSVTGVEPSPEACAVARDRGVDAREGTLADVELDPESYDVAVFRQSLEHVTDPVADLRRVLGALRDGGVAIVSVPNFGSWQRHRFGGAWFHLDLPRHRLHFDADALRATLERGGFADIQTTTSSSTAGLPASIQYAIFGRCLFPGGLALRAAVAACALTGPVAWLADRLAGGGDVLHGVAHKRRTSGGMPLQT
jgi:N-acetylglucosaminyl-diphospho-decaprenol L-rhamnosyltransferase